MSFAGSINLNLFPVRIITPVAAGIVCLYVSIRLLRRPKYQIPTDEPTQHGSSITLNHLIDPTIRAHHPDFNSSLIEKYPDHDAVQVDGLVGGYPVYIIHKYERVMEALSNHAMLASNPWPENRSLVTLNTMGKIDHDRVYRIIKKFYTPGTIAQIKDSISGLVAEHGRVLRNDGDVVKFAKRLHMHVSLMTSGLLHGLSVDDPRIDQFVLWNDIAVRLTAPLGGIGKRPNMSVTSCMRMLKGMSKSICGVLALISRIGVLQAWKLLSPIEAIFPSAPYSPTWEYPELLREIPEYFNTLYDLMASSDTNTAAGALFSNIGTGLTASEALATAVQLMVNMTTANSIMSLIYNRISDPSISCETVLAMDAPLQRNPRRAVVDVNVGKTKIPKGSIILLMIGAANLGCPEGKTPATFGFGLHQCIGRHLVNEELECVSEWLMELASTTAMSVKPGMKRLVDIDVGNWGFSKLEVSFSP